MKKTFLVLLVTLFSIIYFGCNKDNPVAPGGGGTTTRTNSFGKTNGTVQINTGMNQDIITVDSTGTINSLQFSLDTIYGTNAQQLVIFIEHNGVRDTLLNQPPNSGTAFVGTVFRDDAANSINTGSGTYTGTFKPYKPLSAFNGQSINGKWTLYIYSLVSGRSGVIKSWSVTINYNPVQQQTWPMAIGNKWISETRDTLGNLMGKDTTSLPYTITYNGKTLYRLFWYNRPYDSVYVTNESDGIWAYKLGSQGYSILIFKYPINAGDRYIGGKNGDTVICISTNATVVTPLGTYTGCVQYAMKDYGIFKEYSYLKPGIGEVGVDNYNPIGILVSRDRLIYFEQHK